MSEAGTSTIAVRDTASGVVADVDYYPHDTIQDLHNMLMEQGFLSAKSGGAVGGSYEFTLMPQNRQLRNSETIAGLPLQPDAVIEVAWAIEAGGQDL